MTRLKTMSLCAVAAALLMMGSCGKDPLVPECDGSAPTYDTDIKKILDANCSGSQCHSSNGREVPLTNYGQLKPYLDDGTFNREVLVDQSMPNGPATLTQAEINAIQCWMENGYAEN